MKNIVICCDGTGNEYGKNNTNVVEIYSIARKSATQIAFYDPGVGTGGWEYEEESCTLKAKHDQATGTGLQKNVEEAYKFLMECHEEGDRLYMFGFSRGAFTVRALAGMLYKVGLLRIDNDNLVEYASKIYTNKDQSYSADIARGFRTTFSRPCPAYFIGVWDTVESLVLNAGRKFYNHQLNPEVGYGFQALAIDEKRRDFLPCPWDETIKIDGQTIQQVWFPGVHSDVGGWYDERGLSNVSLRWMIEKAGACGMEIDEARVQRYRPDPFDVLHESYEGFWIFRGSEVRAIPEGACIHASVAERMKNPAARYTPTNLPQKYVLVE